MIPFVAKNACNASTRLYTDKPANTRRERKSELGVHKADKFHPTICLPEEKIQHSEVGVTYIVPKGAVGLVLCEIRRALRSQL